MENIEKREETQMQVSYSQKSDIISLVIVGSVASYYVARVWPMRAAALAGTVIPAGFGALVLVTLGLLVVSMAVLHAVLAMGVEKIPQPTAQETLAALKSRRNAFGVMVFGAVAIIGLLFVGYPAFCMANFAMLSLLLAEITRLVSRLIYNRRNA